jgi:hypothetical protein
MPSLRCSDLARSRLELAVETGSDDDNLDGYLKVSAGREHQGVGERAG